MEMVLKFVVVSFLNFSLDCIYINKSRASACSVRARGRGRRPPACSNNTPRHFVFING